VLVVLFVAGVSFSNVDLHTLVGAVENAWCFQAEAIFDWLKETTFVGRRPAVLMLCLVSTLLMQLKVCPTKGKKATNVSFSLGISSVPGGLRA
jgi:hypothetical protein